MAQDIRLSSGLTARVTNRMADGTIRDSMEGVVLHETEETKQIFEVFYTILHNILRREAAGNSTEDP